MPGKSGNSGTVRNKQLSFIKKNKNTKTKPKTKTRKSKQNKTKETHTHTHTPSIYLSKINTINIGSNGVRD